MGSPAGGAASGAAGCRRGRPARRAADRLFGLAAVLVLPLTLLLALQWPLRDAIGAGARTCNDLGQICFAWFVAFAVTAATRAGAHVAPHVEPGDHRRRAQRARALRWATAAAVLPWAGFVLVTGAGSAWRALLAHESFPDSYTPGYFLVKLAAIVLAALMLAQAIAVLRRPGRG